MGDSRNFRITLNLSNFFHDHRAICRIFINKKMKYISDLQDHIFNIFNLSDFYLMSQSHYIPPTEDIRILEESDILFAIPNARTNTAIYTSTPIVKQPAHLSVKEKRKRCIVDEEKEDSSSNIVCSNNRKKKKKTKECVPEQLKEYTTVETELHENVIAEADIKNNKEKTKKKKKKQNVNLEECIENKLDQSVKEKVLYFEKHLILDSSKQSAEGNDQGNSINDQGNINTVIDHQLKQQEQNDLEKINNVIIQPALNNEENQGSSCNEFRHKKLFVQKRNANIIDFNLPKHTNVVKSILVSRKSLNTDKFQNKIEKNNTFHVQNADVNNCVNSITKKNDVNKFEDQVNGEVVPEANGNLKVPKLKNELLHTYMLSEDVEKNKHTDVINKYENVVNAESATKADENLKVSILKNDLLHNYMLPEEVDNNMCTDVMNKFEHVVNAESATEADENLKVSILKNHLLHTYMLPEEVDNNIYTDAESAIKADENLEVSKLKNDSLHLSMLYKEVDNKECTKLISTDNSQYDTNETYMHTSKTKNIEDIENNTEISQPFNCSNKYDDIKSIDNKRISKDNETDRSAPFNIETHTAPKYEENALDKSSGINVSEVSSCVNIDISSEHEQSLHEVQSCSGLSTYVDNCDNQNYVTKRKRKRSRRKHQSKSVNNITPPVVTNFECERRISSAAVHIKFNDDGEPVRISDGDMKQNTREVVRISDGDMERSAREEVQPYKNDVNESSNVSRNESGYFQTDMEKENVLPNDNNCITVSDITEDVDRWMSCANNDLISENTILKSPLMTSTKPKVGDLIAFKILRLTEDYTPALSKYIIGEILSVADNTLDVDIKIIDGIDQCAEPEGKFAIETENKEFCNIKSYCWSSLISPRLIYP